MPLFVMFRGNTCDTPFVSEKSVTHRGRYRREQNHTVYHYDKNDCLDYDLSLELENISFEDLKSSTLQICVIYDKNYANEQTQKLKEKTTIF